MRCSVLLLLGVAGLSGGAVHAATQVGTLGVSAVVIDRCAVLTSDRAVTGVRCDHALPHRIEQRTIMVQGDAAQPATGPVTGTVITY